MTRVFVASGRLVKPVALVLTVVAVGSVLVGVSLAAQGSSKSAAMSGVPSPPAMVSATRIIGRRGALRPGTVVRSADLGVRVFPNAGHGFALASVGEGQYPAASVDGGRTWRVDGPVLHVNAAQAPLVVLQVGAASQRTYFAWGGPGGGQVVDVTSDGGKHWWQAILGDVVMAVVASGDGRLIAFSQSTANSSPTSAVTWVYVSKDGGRHWRYNNRLGGL
jgi:hypothetical protein